MEQLELKYKPTTLEEFWGSKDEVNLFKELSKNNSIPNNILISGRPGIGKSSLAYIISKLILCNNKVDGEPCNTCENCKLIEDMTLTGESPDKRKIYRLSLGVDGSDESEYIDRIATAIGTQKKSPMIYFIDELQMIGKLEQEKLNNPMEYTNSNTYVIMTTSSVESIAKSIITRCKHVSLTSPSLDEQVRKLQYICHREGLSLTENQLRELVTHSDYNPRTVMKNLTDIKKCGEDKFYSVIKDSNKVFELCINFFKTLNYGTFNLISFIEGLEDVNKLYYSLPDFIYQLLKFKYNISSVHPDFKQDLKEISYTYKEKSLMEILKIYDNHTGYLSKDKIKIRLVRIAFDLSNSLCDFINEPDEVTSVINPTATYEDTEAQKREAVKKQISTVAFNPTNINLDDIL